MTDPWDELGPLYRRRIRTRVARVASCVRLRRPPHMPKPKRVIAVWHRDGRMVDPQEYALKPYQSWYEARASGGCLFFKTPQLTSGMTVLFE